MWMTQHVCLNDQAMPPFFFHNWRTGENHSWSADVRSSMWKLRSHGLCQARNCKCPFRSNAISERRKRRTKPGLCSDGKNEENHMERRLWSKQMLLWFPHLAFHLPFRCRIDMQSGVRVGFPGGCSHTTTSKALSGKDFDTIFIHSHCANRHVKFVQVVWKKSWQQSQVFKTNRTKPNRKQQTENNNQAVSTKRLGSVPYIQ